MKTKLVCLCLSAMLFFLNTGCAAAGGMAAGVIGGDRPVQSIPPDKKDAFISGSYQRVSGETADGSLKLTNVTEKDFSFTLEALRFDPMTDNVNTGAVSGIAKIEGERAVFRDAQSGAVLIFSLSAGVIGIEQNEKANWYAGMGVAFTGKYVPEETA